MSHDPRAALLGAADTLREQESSGDRNFASAMGPLAREQLAERANSAAFREGVDEGDIARKIIDELVAPLMKEATKAADDTIKEARIGLLEAAGSAAVQCG